jgi:hypothetical protein
MKMSLIAKIQKGYTTRDINEKEKNFYFLTNKDLIGKLDYINIKQVSLKSSKFLLEEGDIIMSSIGNSNLRVITEEEARKKLIVSNNLFVLKCFEKKHINLLYNFLKSNTFKKRLKRIETGTIIKQYKLKDLKEIEINIDNYSNEKLEKINNFLKTKNILFDLLEKQKEIYSKLSNEIVRAL